MHAKTNQNNEVLIRFEVKDIKNSQWSSLYSQMYAYRFVTDLKDGSNSYGKRIIFKVALTEEWMKERIDVGMGFQCLNCKDTGLDENRDFCYCSLGQAAKRYFGNQTNIENEHK